MNDAQKRLVLMESVYTEMSGNRAGLISMSEETKALKARAAGEQEQELCLRDGKDRDRIRAFEEPEKGKLHYAQGGRPIQGETTMSSSLREWTSIRPSTLYTGYPTPASW